MAQEKKSVVPINVEFLYASKNENKTYELSYDDGTTEKILIFSKYQDFQPETGKEIHLFKGEYGTWCLDASAMGLSDYKPTNSRPASSGSTSKAGSSGGSMTKDQYERTVRDPKIEFQTYFNHVMSAYVAAIPHLDNPPATLAQINDLVNSAFDQACEIVRKVHDREDRMSK